MIDKLELRLPHLTQFRPAIREFMLESRHFQNSARSMASGRYEWVSDLRPVGVDALLHYSLKRPDNDPHEGESKLELLDTGQKSYSGFVTQLESTIEGPIDELELMRIDLCADIYKVPVLWFLPRVRVKHKRTAYEVGNLKYQRIGKQGIQTITAGKRPNIVRIYDKKAEYEEQIRKMKRKQSRDADQITIQSEFGVPDDATITRIERQFGGGRIPTEIDCFRKLIYLPEYNPFTNIEINNGTDAALPTISECGLTTWAAGNYLRQMQREMGSQQFHRWLGANSAGNGARYMKRYSGFLQPSGDASVTAISIFEVYRESVKKQLAA